MSQTCGSDTSLVTGKISLVFRCSGEGLAGADWELDFKPCSFHHIMQVLRVCRFSTSALPPAFPPCCCPQPFGVR